MLSQWDRLRGWIEERREHLLLHRRLVEAVAEWEDAGRNPEYLPREGRLAQFEAWAGATDLALTAGERAFLAEARAAADATARRRTRRRRATLAGFATLAAGASLGAVFALGPATVRPCVGRPRRRGAARRAGAAEGRPRPVAPPGPGERGWIRLSGHAREPPRCAPAQPCGDRTLHGDGDVQDRVAMSPDGRLVATSDYFGTLMLFDLATRTRSGSALQLSSVDDPGPYGLWALAFSPDGKTLAVVSKGLRELDLVDVRSRAVRRVERFPFDAATRSFTNYGLAYSPDGRTLLTSEAIFDEAGNHIRTEIVFRDGATGRRLGRTIDAGTLGTEEPYVGHGPRLALSFTPDGRSIVADDTRRAVVWDAKTGRRLRTFAPALSFAVSPAGNALALGREDGSVAVASLDSGKTRELSGHHGGAVNGAAFTPDGNSLLTAGTDGDVLVSGCRIGLDPRDALRPCRERPGTPPSRRTAGRQSRSPTTRRLSCGDLTGRRRLSRSSSVVPSTNSDLSADGKILAVTTEQGIRLLDGSSLRARGSIPVARRPLRVAFSPDGSRLAVTLQSPKPPAPGYFTGGTVALYDVKRRGDLSRGTSFRTRGRSTSTRPAIQSPSPGRTGACPSFDAHSLAVSAKPIVQPKRPYAKGGSWHSDLDWSPDGRRLAITYVDGRISVWDTTNGTLLVNLPQKPHAFQAAFTPDGSLLVTGGNTGIPSFWDTRTWKLVARPVQGHGSAIVGMSVDPGGRTVATAGNDDGDVVLWDVASRRQTRGGPRSSSRRDHRPRRRSRRGGCNARSCCGWVRSASPRRRAGDREDGSLGGRASGGGRAWLPHPVVETGEGRRTAVARSLRRSLLDRLTGAALATPRAAAASARCRTATGRSRGPGRGSAHSLSRDPRPHSSPRGRVAGPARSRRRAVGG